MAAANAPGRLLWIGRTDDVEPGNHPQHGDRLNRLVGGTIFTYADGIVSVDVSDRQLRERREANRRPRVIGKHEKGRTARAEDAVVGHAVIDRGHAVLADAIAQVTPGAMVWIEIRVGGDVVKG